eukprot:g8900.t1
MRRTRKAPDFYSPETPCSRTETKSKKIDSDENDSWKPESDSEDVESASESERSTSRHRTGPRRRLAIQKCSSLEAEGPGAKTPLHSSDNSDHEEKSKKDEIKQKKIKGVRELQNLLDGHAQVHKESRYRRLASRRDRRLTGVSESTWSNASSSKAADEKPREMEEDPSVSPRASTQEDDTQQNARIGVKSLMNTSLKEDQSSEEANGEGNSSKQSASFQNGSHITTRVKSESLTIARGMRAKRQRLDFGSPSEKLRENGRRRRASMPQLKSTEFKLPRLPMIRSGEYWYRARIKDENHENIYVEFTGFEDSNLKPFWIAKDSDDVFKGSYSGKDWKHLGDGAWEPKPRKLITKKPNGRRRKNGRKRRVLPSVAESVATAQDSKIGSFREMPFVIDSEAEFTKSASAILARENGEHSLPILNPNEHQSRYRATLNSDPTRPESCLEGRESDHPEMKDLDPDGSQSRTREEKAVPSMESCPDQDSNQQPMDSPLPGEGLMKEEGGGGVNEDNSPLSRIGASPMNVRTVEEESLPLKQDQNNSTRGMNHSSSNGVDNNSEERVVQPRCRRKQNTLANFRRLRIEDDPILTRRPNELRRSARLGWKSSWKSSNFKDESSSEAECEDESIRNLNTTRRKLMNSRSGGGGGGSKYVTRPSQSLEIIGGGGRQNRKCVYQTRPKRSRRVNGGRSKEEFDLEEESFDLEERTPTTPPATPLEDHHHHRRISGSQVLDEMEVLNFGVNAFAQIRKYLPYYNSHIADANLPSFVELMEKLNGVNVKELASSFVQVKSKNDGLRTRKHHHHQLEHNLSLPSTTRLDSSEIQP